MSTTKVRERPILFSSPMVNAILSDAKTQTRRIVKPQPDELSDKGPYRAAPVTRLTHDFRTEVLTHSPESGLLFIEPIKCPYTVGDRLWVREAHAIPRAEHEITDSVDVLYRADPIFDSMDPSEFAWRWRPSIHMPRWASRITLEITDVRCERLQDITEADARAEGVEPEAEGCYTQNSMGAYYKFMYLWNAINGKRATWESNPWVWVVAFQRTPTDAGNQ